MLHRPGDLTVLMRAANRGDAAAYRQLLRDLVAILRMQVRRTLNRFGRGHEDAEDIVQETMLAIHLKRHTWDENQPLTPWLRAIAHHKLVDHLRRKGFREHVDIEDFADSLGAPIADRDGDLQDCTRLLAVLPERQRRVVEGVSIEGQSAREVGQRLGMSESAVRVALHRALKLMAQAYRRDDE